MRGMEKDLVIIDRRDYLQNKRWMEPEILFVVRAGTGWIDVRMTDGLVYRREGGSLSWRYNNPGNIKFGKFARTHRAVGQGWEGHSVFPTYTLGRRAKYDLLFSPRKKYYKLSIRDAMRYYAPRSDQNRPDIYARFVANKIPGATVHTKLRDLNSDQREILLGAMQKFEGFRSGVVRIL